MAVINGTKFDDRNPPIFDIIGNDQIFALDGNDFIRMIDGGNDEVHGDGGFDTIFYEDYSSGVTINFVTGLLTDGFGNTDKLFDIESAHGSSFNDVITMAAGTGYVMGRAGSDTINFNATSGGTAWGGSGNDTFNGGAGFDHVDYSDDGLDKAGVITQGINIDLSTGKGTDGWGHSDTFKSIEGITGTQFNDTIVGTIEGDKFFTGDGDDTINATGASAGSLDIVFAGKGNDTITVSGNALVRGDEGNDRIIGNPSGGSFHYVIEVQPETSTSAITVNLTTATRNGLAGGSNATGYRMDDGLGGIDLISGVHIVDDTDFDDKFYIDSSYKTSSLDNEVAASLSAGNDYVEFIGVESGGVNYTHAKGGVFIDAAGQLARDMTPGDSFIGTDTIIGMARLVGSSFADEIHGNVAIKEIHGLGGADKIFGGEGFDVLWGDDEDHDEVDPQDGNDQIFGGGGNDRLYGDGGDDLLDGGTNVFAGDWLQGGTGNDTYIVDDFYDDVIEFKNEGTDIVFSSVDFNLAKNHVENLTLTGIADIHGHGNSYDNIIVGNAGNNHLTGEWGADTMIGGLGNDGYGVDNVNDKVIEADNGGIDSVSSTVSYSLAGLYVENLSLSGEGHINATGNSLANTIKGNYFGNNLIDGGWGADKMLGLAGNDTYVVDNVGDKVTELDKEGTDTVNSSVTYALTGQYIEVLNLTGSGNINATGNSLANTVTGNAGNNLIDGAWGADKMSGGGGDDTFIVDNAGDTVSEANVTGIDTVNSTASFSLAGQFVEILNLLGSGNTNGIGNSLANTINGNSGNNVIDGGWGADILTGNGGSDFFRFATPLSVANVDEVTDFTVNVDKIQLSATVFEALRGALDPDELVMNTNPTATANTHRLLYDTDDGFLYFDADADGAGARVLFAKLDAGLLLDNLDFQIV